MSRGLTVGARVANSLLRGGLRTAARGEWEWLTRSHRLRCWRRYAPARRWRNKRRGPSWSGSSAGWRAPFFSDTSEARRELAAKVAERNARVAARRAAAEEHDLRVDERRRQLDFERLAALRRRDAILERRPVGFRDLPRTQEGGGALHVGERALGEQRRQEVTNAERTHQVAKALELGNAKDAHRGYRRVVGASERRRLPIAPIVCPCTTSRASCTIPLVSLRRTVSV